MPREATKEDITAVIKAFVESAQHAKAAGFDGGEIHGANGYILDQFLTDYTNHRTDEYGGSTEKVVRSLVEVSKAVREAVGHHNAPEPSSDAYLLFIAELTACLHDQ